MSFSREEGSRLADRLRDRIGREGPISFRDFMASALYDPRDGYYSRGARIGERGDFVTSPYVSPSFAATLARRFATEVAAIPGEVDFVEVGAGEGRLLEDFDAALARDSPEAASRARYTAIESSEACRRSLAARRLSRELRVLSSADELAPRSVRGWIFSNELFDAVPVSRVVGTGDGLRELRVAADGDGFRWVEAPAGEELAKRLERFGTVLAPGQEAEVALEAAELYARLAKALAIGSLVTFDYGHRARVLYHSVARPRGTLAVHFGGRRQADPLFRPGDVDLTAHVNWDELIAAGEEEGLETVGLFRQGRFLVESGIFDFTPTDAERWRAYRLVDPEGMGDELSVLVQTRAARV